MTASQAELLQKSDANSVSSSLRCVHGRCGKWLKHSIVVRELDHRFKPTTCQLGSVSSRYSGFPCQEMVSNKLYFMF